MQNKLEKSNYKKAIKKQEICFPIQKSIYFFTGIFFTLIQTYKSLHSNTIKRMLTYKNM